MEFPNGIQRIHLPESEASLTTLNTEESEQKAANQACFWQNEEPAWLYKMLQLTKSVPHKLLSAPLRSTESQNPASVG
jgi:hypothetical protein